MGFYLFIYFFYTHRLEIRARLPAALTAIQPLPQTSHYATEMEKKATLSVPARPPVQQFSEEMQAATTVLWMWQWPEVTARRPAKRP